MYLCTQNYDLRRGGTFETAKAGTFHSVTAGTLIPLLAVNGHQVYLCIGGVRAYNEDKLYGRQTTMKFKIFVGWQVRVCSNLCLTCDGLQAT